MLVSARTKDRMNAQTARICSFVPFFGMSRYESELILPILRLKRTEPIIPFDTDDKTAILAIRLTRAVTVLTHLWRTCSSRQRKCGY